MTIFDLLFLLLLLLSAVVFAAALLLWLSRRLARAFPLLRAYALGVAAYFVVVITVSLFLPRHELVMRKPLCFDDWCIAVQNINRAPGDGEIRYQVKLQLSSKARRITQRENNLVLYISDERGRRYNRLAEPSLLPFNAPLAPGETIDVTRNFEVPLGARHPGLVIAHEGGFPIGWFIIGYDTWFRKPPILRLPE